jgi:phage terminase small subunit
VKEFDLAPHQLRTLQVVAEAWDRKEEARKVLAREGLSYVDAKGMHRARPEVAVERDSRAAYLRAMRELALDRRAEVKLVLAEMAKVRGEIDAYLDRQRALREVGHDGASQPAIARTD